MKNIAIFDSLSERYWQVKVVNVGERYGRENCLVNDGDQPLVEWIDMKHGQFVSRYHLDIMQNHVGALILDGGIPEWRVDADTCAAVRSWLSA